MHSPGDLLAALVMWGLAIFVISALYGERK